MKKYKAGIIGLGVGERHIEGYEAHPQVTVAKLCDKDPAKRAMARKKYPGCKVTDSANSVLDDLDIDMVSIASYDDDHARQAIRALESGKSIFVEKPLCLYRHEAEAIRRLLYRRTDLRLSSNLILRKCPRFLKLRDRIQQGKLGSLFSIEGDYNYGRLHKVTEGWRGDLDFYSVVYGGGVHMVDLLLWLTGQRVLEVAAFGNRIASEGSKFKHHDFVGALLRFESGLVGKVAANFGCVCPHFHRLTVYGTEATFTHDLQGAYWYADRDPEAAPEPIHDEYPGYQKGDYLFRFAEAVIHGGEPEVSADEVFDAMSVCFAIEEAAGSGGTVPVDYI